MVSYKKILAEVRKNPGVDSEDIAATLGGTPNAVATTMLRLTRYKLVRRERAHYYRESDARRVSRFIYFCEDKRAMSKEKPVATVAQTEPVDVVVPVTTSQAPAPTKIDIDALPLAEARRLYLQLREVFEPKNC